MRDTAYSHMAAEEERAGDANIASTEYTGEANAGAATVALAHPLSYNIPLGRAPFRL